MDRIPEKDTNEKTGGKVDWMVVAMVAILGASSVWMLVHSGLAGAVNARMERVISAAVERVGREG
ncbi:hypothetical protein [Pseudogemmobacter faecipullorum]|uniref:Uncharacterized protein n=1 Tax=Pseudogemmobacter faecipullorum TaxID=2755041 RepID=A0ABS8CH79_9RHOB|nr:hypothetical protein [Pseudogemmobacter faecipullorum]MCB5408730.1 hypothetical protein [Pseudogemmobacter faecipullorum]